MLELLFNEAQSINTPGDNEIYSLEPISKFFCDDLFPLINGEKSISCEKIMTFSNDNKNEKNLKFVINKLTNNKRKRGRKNYIKEIKENKIKIHDKNTSDNLKKKNSSSLFIFYCIFFK